VAEPSIAAQLYTVREFTRTAEDIASTMRRVREIGYRAVQVSALGPIAPEELKRIVDAEGLTICITHTSYDRLWNDLDAVIAEHRLWSCPNVAIGSMPRPYLEEGEAGYHRFAREANEVGRKLHDAGMTFSYHNHNMEFERHGSRIGLDILLDETDPRYVQAEIDVYWVQAGGGDPAAWIRKVTGRMPVVHLKDMTVKGRQAIMAEVGEGNLNWPAIMDACREARVRWYAVEQDICQRDPFESLAISYRNLRGMGLE
jgi:sugar phosphate isomerase/epimerase